ncbi:uncharacterized protein LOC127153451 [Labeo rohita]|uniref:uncharacterized protein LOC127153451 n=1 Tax=Labeo rohita TaxID=84645 RepID=UPI0021E2242D|nr:uncharacterized protein LOC127153451 [Labeo rohita]
MESPCSDLHTQGRPVDAVKSVSVLEGDSVTGLTEMMDYDLILWSFGTENTLIAQINVINEGITVYDDVLDGRFRDRLKLDHQTRSLTITNTTIQHAGLYKLQTNCVSKNFSHSHLPLPDIFIRDSFSSSSSYCSLVCSVVNVSDVTLSWYKGNSLLSSISVSDLSISLSLPLEVEYQDKNTYSCVINNPISNQTTHLDISKLCHICSEVHIHCFATVETDWLRLVVTVLMGVAAVVLLVSDIRSARVGEEFKVAKCRAVMMCKDSCNEKVRDAGIITRSGHKWAADTSVAQAKSMLKLKDIIGNRAWEDKDSDQCMTLLHSVPHLHRWGMREDSLCSLYGGRGTLAHMLAGFKTAFSQGRYRWHHKVLSALANILEQERRKKHQNHTVKSDRLLNCVNRL